MMKNRIWVAPRCTVNDNDQREQGDEQRQRIALLPVQHAAGRTIRRNIDRGKAEQCHCQQPNSMAISSQKVESPSSWRARRSADAETGLASTFSTP